MRDSWYGRNLREKTQPFNLPPKQPSSLQSAITVHITISTEYSSFTTTAASSNCHTTGISKSNSPGCVASRNDRYGTNFLTNHLQFSRLCIGSLALTSTMEECQMPLLETIVIPVFSCADDSNLINAFKHYLISHWNWPGSQRGHYNLQLTLLGKISITINVMNS